MRGRHLRIGLGVLLLAAACSPRAAAPAASDSPSATPEPVSSAAADLRAELRVTVTNATYGTLALSAPANAVCRAELEIPKGFYGEPAPTALTAQTVSAGAVRWTYSAPRVPNGAGSYKVTCEDGASTGTASGSFEISLPAMKAAALSVRVTTELPPREIVNTDASLVPLRDADAAKMVATLSTEWRSATRGLGGLTIVDRSPDITIYVIAAKGTSVHRKNGRDGSEDILIYAADRLGPKAVENSVATALHELGHIWCCYGPGTYSAEAEQRGHWLTNERSPGLYGPDKYGLMTDPVTCVVFPTFVSCPNRFSDREMVELGFATFPAPTVDPCVSQALALDRSIVSLKALLDSQSATLTSLNGQIKAIEAQYPSRNYPPSVRARYDQLVDQYNAAVGTYNQTLGSYNASVRQYNALPCDAT